MKKDVNIVFGKKVADLRHKLGISQEEFAFRCHMHRTYIGTIERGEKSPTLNTISVLAEVLGVSIYELFID